MVPISCRPMKGGDSVLVMGIDVRAFAKQRCDALVMPMLGRLVQGRFAVLIGTIRVAAIRQAMHDLLRIAETRRAMKKINDGLREV